MQTGKKKIIENGAFHEFVLGCSTEEEMFEWMSLL
jgi:hypothetical protein